MELRDRVFMTSVEVVEFGVLLGRSKNTAKWSWLFKTYMQWHAVAYVLSELCTRPEGVDYNRAWAAVDSIYDRRMIEQTKSHRGVLWRPLKQLYTRAKKRRQELQQSRCPASNNDNNNKSTKSMTNGVPANNPSGANPYINVVSSSAEAFGLDFNGTVLDDMIMAAFSGQENDPVVDGQGQLQDQGTFPSPSDTLSFGLQPGMVDFLDDYGGFQMSPQDFRQQVPQEWH